MKTFRLFSMAAVALLMAACSNSDDFDVQKPAETAGVFHFEATIAAPNADASTRTVYTENGTTINVKWKVGDQIALVHNGVKDVAEVKTVDNVTGKATIEADITGSPSDDDVVYLAYPADAVADATTPYPPFPFIPNPDIFDKVKNDQDGTLAYIQDNLDLRMGSGKLAVSGSDVTLKGSVSVPSLICIWKLTLQDNASTPLSATKLTFKNNDDTQAGATSTGKSEYYLCVVPSFIPDPSGTYSFEATVGSDTYTFSKTGLSLTEGKFYQSTLKMTEVVPEAVDLGLSVKWASMNVGATSESDYGDYFAWGETTGYGSDTGDGHNFGWANYKWDAGSDENAYTYKFKKYVQTTKSDFWGGSGDTPDGKTTLDPEDDAAHANWGGSWRIPTYTELKELADTYNTDANDNSKTHLWEWKENYNGSGHNGYLITCRANGNSIFLPAAGYRYGSSLDSQGSNGLYRSSTLDENFPNYAQYLFFNSDYATVSYDRRCVGFPVRPVQGAATPVVPDGAISGKFSVNSSGDKVYFSKGNLQYIGSAATPYWQFAEHQYDYLGTTTSQNSDATNVDRDLFGWGTSGKKFDSGYGSCYQPYNTTNAKAEYGPTDGTSGLTGTYADGDWGVNMGTGWRTLTKDEWEYLFNTRTVNGGSGNGKSYTLGQSVNDVSGVVLYPDDYTGEVYTTAKSANWSDFESAGCVFLPVAGCRSAGTSVQGLGSYGYYWSSTACTTNGTGIAYLVFFYWDSVNPAGNSSRATGCSVRLVREVPAGSQGTGANDRSYGSQNDLGTW